MFVINYPGYVGQLNDDDEYHITHPGLGFKYTSVKVLAEPPLIYTRYVVI